MSYPNPLYLIGIIASLAQPVLAQVAGPSPLPLPLAPASQPATATTKPVTEPASEPPKPLTSRLATPTSTGPATPAAAPGLPAAPNPQRELQSSDEVRRQVRGALPLPKVTPTQEMAELRKFEENAFPRASEPDPGAAQRPPRPGVQHPPPELRSGSHHASPSHGAKPPERWLSRLALPTLPVRWDPRVIRYLEFYRDNPRGRAIMEAWLRRMGHYRSLVLRVLREHKVPQDLAYVAMVESGFNPALTSRVGAAGIWQFMSGTGKGYGLHQDHWIDERRNPRLSTEAAARYLKDLHARFNSWELALAAYNAGYGAVESSIQKYNTNDYWQICRYESGLPWSTTLYVPKILAAAIIGRNLSYFGYAQVKPEPELTHELVSVPVSITVAQAARAAGVETSIIERLNPELRRGRTPPSSKAWIRVPRGTQSAFYASLARMKGQVACHRPYIVRLGDSVESVAADHAISQATVRQINGLGRSEPLRPGLVILVPARPVTPTASPNASAPPPAPAQEPLLVAVPDGVPTQIEGGVRVFYRTVPGDGLHRVARQLQVNPVQLARWNALAPEARLIPGMVLQAFVAPELDRSRVRLLDPSAIRVAVAGSEDFLNAYEERKGRKRLVYTARAGDSLSSVGQRFGLSVGSLARINRFSRDTQLGQGQRIVVYVTARSRKPISK